MVTTLFNHATIGGGFDALGAIRDKGVNLAIARGVVDDQTSAYLSGINWQQHFLNEWNAAPAPMGREGICNRNCGACPLEPSNGDRMSIKPADFGMFDPADTEGVIISALHRFPKGSGLDAFAQTISSAVKGFVTATGAETVRADLIAKYPVGSSAWHQDGNTIARGLLTFIGPGTFWRANDSIPNEDWAGNVKIDDRGLRRNGYGLFGTFMETARQIETGHMAVFKGGIGSEFPLIHAEPTHTVTGVPRAMRLILTIDKV